MARRRRETTTADQLNVGDTIEPNNNGYRAKVDHLGTSKSCAEPNVTVHWQYPNDFSVNAIHRGQSSGRICQPDDAVTRWS